MPWPVLSRHRLHLPARRQGQLGSGWALLEVVSVAASPRRQTRRGSSPASGCIHGRRHGHAKELARRPGPHNGAPISSSRESLNTMMPHKKGTLFKYVSRGMICRSKSGRLSQFMIPAGSIVFLLLPSVWLFLVAVSFFKM
jgi:hypothetical protein